MVRAADRDRNEITEMWREHRHELQQRRQGRRDRNTPAIEALQSHGFAVRKLTDCQYRVNDVLDLFPTNRRYHYIPTNKRGSYRDPLFIVKAYVTEAT